MDYPKSVPGVGLVGGKFIDEDPVNGIPGSLIPSSWGNAITDELLNVIQYAQLGPDENDHGQLLEALQAIIGSATPDASTTIKGLIEIATATEAKDLASSMSAITPETLGYALQPYISGSITTNGTVDNKIQMDGIVPNLALEVGDVIQITGSTGGSNDRLFTVESVTNDDNIIVNYEHAENRGDGPLRLVNQASVSVTVTRIAKWFNAPLGLGQAWVDVLNHRSLQTTYKSIENRLMAVFIKNTDGTITIDDGDFDFDWDGRGETGCMEIPSYSDYSAKTKSVAELTRWKELR